MATVPVSNKLTRRVLMILLYHKNWPYDTFCPFSIIRNGLHGLLSLHDLHYFWRDKYTVPDLTCRLDNYTKLDQFVDR